MSFLVANMQTAPGIAAATAAESEEEYLGMVKSYNARRGFGFVACEATAAKFGRDVYIGKAEVQILAAALGFAAPHDKSHSLSLEEEDLVRFRVKLSAEGYPQAEHIKLVKKYQGMVLEPPGEAFVAEEAAIGRITSDELAAARGMRETMVRRAACGRAMLSAGDRVTFCLEEPVEGTEPEALLVMLVPRPMHSLGCILGCCVLQLPRTPLPGGWGVYRPDLQLDCHALPDRLILSGLPPDVEQSELMRFFSKHGALQAGIAASRTGAFASISFPGMAEVARFMARAAHTFADDKDTRLVRLLPRCAYAHAGASCGAAQLPGLPAPTIMGGAEPGVLVVTWSPVLLATGYGVELRPAGVQAAWSVVDASEGRLGVGGEAGRFGKDSCSCKVSGLPTNAVFEARVTYVTSCGCASDASDPSEWCLATPYAQPQVNNSMVYPMQPYAPMGMPPGVGGGPMGWPVSVQPPAMPYGAWRCMHGVASLQPSMPEVRVADAYGFSLLVQWPSVGSAVAYVVELREAGAAHLERFVRQVPMQAVGSLVELRIGGLRPGGPGRIYCAQVRSVAVCGCESEPSPMGVSQPQALAGLPQMMPSVAHALPQYLPTPLSLAAACPPSRYSPPVVAPPPSSPLPTSPPPEITPNRQDDVDGAKLAPWQMPSPLKNTCPFTSASPPAGLPSLLQSSSRAPTATSPVAPEVTSPQKELAPEITTPDEDCIILD